MIKRRPGEKPVSNCESCVYFEYDEDLDADVCTVDLDEDEYARYLNGKNASCPYYKYYDEYKSVQKQN